MRRQVQDRKGMLDRAIGLVERARHGGLALDMDAETENLLHENPNCRMSFAELRADFATLVAQRERDLLLASARENEAGPGSRLRLKSRLGASLRSERAANRPNEVGFPKRLLQDD
jgi:hypothetical protein